MATSGWRTIELGDGLFLSHCPALRAGSASDADGERWILLGLAVQTCDGKPDPLAGIAQAGSTEVAGLYPEWAGRWLLVGAGKVHLDASGLLGCFYSRDADGRAWASSSPALLGQLIAGGDGKSAIDPRPLSYDHGLCWYPPPRSRLLAARRLLPSQVLDLRSGTIEPRPLLPRIEPERPYDETLDQLEEALIESLRRLPLNGRPLALGLTAGLDSRVVLAAVEKAQVPFVPFMRIAARMSPADRLIPPQLTEAIGQELEVHRRSFRSRRHTVRERLPLVFAHSAHHVSEGDAQPLLHGVRDTIEGISVGGWAFGVGKALSRDEAPPRVGDPTHDADRIAQGQGEPPGSSAAEGLREWLEWTERTHHDHLDLRDRFYIEQRLAGWQSSKEQVYDMLPLERLPIINSARCYALLLSVDEGRRASQQHQRDLVERLCPPLAGFPHNPPTAELSLPRVLAVKLRDDPRGVMREGWRRLS